jgi:hypothetical protein
MFPPCESGAARAMTERCKSLQVFGAVASAGTQYSANRGPDPKRAGQH